MPALQSIQYRAPRSQDIFPFNLPLLKKLERIQLGEITILVGENGTGKSTLLEALAVKTNLQTFGEYPVTKDPTLESARQLANYLQLSWKIKLHRGFFLRTEDFFEPARYP